MKIVIRGMGWGFEVPATIQDNKVIIEKAEFDDMMKNIAYTHDMVSGGFSWEFEE